MLRTMLKSKIDRAHVTALELEYQGSITLDQDLLDAADLLPGEQVQVLNLNNGSRITTYVIAGERGSGAVILNGPAARTGYPGDPLIVLAYALVDDREAAGFTPRIVRVRPDNRIASG